MQGWIKLHRKLVDWEWYTDIPTKTLFIHLLIEANHEPKKWQGKVIDRGERVTSIGNLAVETGLTKQQVRTAINKLTSSNEITTRATNKYTIVKVLNYSVYQGKDFDEQQTNNNQITRQITNKQQTNNNQITTNKNDKKEKNEKKKESSYCRDDNLLWQLQEMLAVKGFENLSETSQSLCKQYGLYKE